jgi:hypothetical protein
MKIGYLYLQRRQSKYLDPDPKDFNSEVPVDPDPKFLGN